MVWRRRMRPLTGDLRTTGVPIQDDFGLMRYPHGIAPRLVRQRTTPPPGTFTQVSAGGNRSCGLRTGDVTECLGSPTTTTYVPTSTAGAMPVGAGARRSTAPSPAAGAPTASASSSGTSAPGRSCTTTRSAARRFGRGVRTRRREHRDPQIAAGTLTSHRPHRNASAGRGVSSTEPAWAHARLGARTLLDCRAVVP